MALALVEAYCTSATLNLAPVASPVRQPHQFTAELLPFSVTTFVGGLGTGVASWQAGSVR